MKFLNMSKLFTSALIIGASISGEAMAEAKKIGDVASNVGSAGSSILDGLLSILALIGFVTFVISGVKLLHNKQQQQDSPGKLWGALASGILLMTPLLFLAIFSDTVTDQTGGKTAVEESLGYKKGS